MHVFADFTLQGDTTNIRTIGAAHRQHIGPGFQRQFGRHAIGIFRLCFGPVESDTKSGTAGAALLAGMAHAFMITQTKKRRVVDTPFFVSNYKNLLDFEIHCFRRSAVQGNFHLVFAGRPRVAVGQFEVGGGIALG